MLGLVEVADNENTTDANGRPVQNTIRVRAAGEGVAVGTCRLGQRASPDNLILLVGWRDPVLGASQP
ncbi:hypothetical protein APR04_005813 [Promicromonospora umidemergens]|uniref:Uncharacterized protein n=1 Tax=Promicromonospora umidemergens TaxID=629679 RepID=A0ABP8YDI8_9MICO|nr:hypothetical protein [Promicromonospora umidemergens]MCP2286868.1 hypothetical protein [Promicromonospora umidemergens]